jgi:hypothetical protein
MGRRGWLACVSQDGGRDLGRSAGASYLVRSGLVRGIGPCWWSAACCLRVACNRQTGSLLHYQANTLAAESPARVAECRLAGCTKQRHSRLYLHPGTGAVDASRSKAQPVRDGPGRRNVVVVLCVACIMSAALLRVFHPAPSTHSTRYRCLQQPLHMHAAALLSRCLLLAGALVLTGHPVLGLP